jgi:hypothetical protein
MAARARDTERERLPCCALASKAMARASLSAALLKRVSQAANPGLDQPGVTGYGAPAPSAAINLAAPWRRRSAPSVRRCPPAWVAGDAVWPAARFISRPLGRQRSLGRSLNLRRLKTPAPARSATVLDQCVAEIGRLLWCSVTVLPAPRAEQRDQFRCASPS